MTCPNRVLLIDDDQDDIQIFSMVLKNLYPLIEITAEVESEQALTDLLLEKIPKPDYIFLDLNMPRIDGLKCLPVIKNIPLYKDTPIVMYSTSNDAHDKAIALRLGASYFLTKSYTIDQIHKSLSAFFTSELIH